MLYAYRSEGKGFFYFLHAGEHPTLEGLKCLDALPGFDLVDFYGDDLMKNLENQSFKSATQFSDYLWGQIESYDDFFFLEMDCTFDHDAVTFHGHDNLEFTFGCDVGVEMDVLPVFIEFVLTMLGLDKSAAESLEASLRFTQQNPNEYHYFNLQFERLATFPDFDAYLSFYDSNYQ